MLKLTDVQTFYGNIQALKGVTLEISENEIITLIGANGAGKTTTLMAVCGVVPPRSGEILFMGEPITGMSPNKIVSLGICQVPEGRRIFPYLTVLENLDMGAYLRKDKAEIKKDMDYVLDMFPILAQTTPVRGNTERGRTADAGHIEGAHGTTETSSPRRTFSGARPTCRQADLRNYKEDK